MNESLINKNGKYKSKKFKYRDFELLWMAGIGVIFLLIFAYLPMGGIILAFKDGDNQLNVLNAIFKTKFVGFTNFMNFIRDQRFVDVLLNTLGLNIIGLVITFPAPILFALLLNELKNKRFKKVVQSVSIFPHFLSWVVFGGIIIAMADMTTGIINPIMYFLGFGSRDNPINVLTAEYFWTLVIVSGLVKGIGWGSVIYLAAMTAIDRVLYEAAEIDGAGRFAKMLHITVPLIMPTITIYILLQISNLLSNSFKQFYMLQNATNLSRSEVLSTYIYKTGIIQRRYSYTAALGFFESVTGFILLIGANSIAKKVSGRGIYSE